MIELNNYLELKRILSGLMTKHPGKYIIKALGELYISLGDKLVLKGMCTGDGKLWKKGEETCYLGRELIKIGKEFEQRIK